MKRFIEGLDRRQTTLLPDCVDDYADEDNPVRAVDAFVEMLNLAALGFDIEPETTGRPGYHPTTMLTSSTSTVISTKCSRRVGWSANVRAIWN